MAVEVLHERCCGLDVHKKTVVACALPPGPGGVPRKERRTFGAMTGELRGLGEWLRGLGVTHVAMEATGVYWKPVYDVLEGEGERGGDGFELLVVNAQHIKAVPGRKTDVADAEWIASLLRHGLLRGSYIPERGRRELRELTRARTALIRERARVVQRLEKALEGGSIKLGAVLTDIAGVSGRRILDALVGGEADPEVLADLAHWRVQRKREQLEAALVGDLGGALRFLVGRHLEHWRELDARIERFDGEVERLMRPFGAQLGLLRGIPGVGERTAQVIVAEAGVEMGRFPSARHLAAWAGMCPGNRQSGGRDRPARTRHGSPWLRAALAESAWAASRCKVGYLPAQFRRLAARRGRKRAIVAVGHSILAIAYHLLTDGTPYEDLGGAYFDSRDQAAAERRAVGKLEALGYAVTLVPTAPPDPDPEDRLMAAG